MWKILAKALFIIDIESLYKLLEKEIFCEYVFPLFIFNDKLGFSKDLFCLRIIQKPILENEFLNTSSVPFQ